MLLDITLKNYRCFPDTAPVRLSIRKGFTAFVGSNNSGKSSLLRFFVEFRNLFSTLAGGLPDSLATQRVTFQLANVPDIPEVFSNTNDRNISIEFTLSPGPEDDPADLPTALATLSLEVIRDQNVFRVTKASTLSNQDVPLSRHLVITSDREFLTESTGPRLAYVGPIIRALTSCANSIYLPAFRNAVNVGGTSTYYDIQVGEQFIRSWKAFKAGVIKQKSNAAYRLTQDIKHIFGFHDLEILNSEDDKTLILFVDGHSFRLDEVGSGLSQFVLVLATVALRSHDFVLIDEPELNLHPTLQMDFLTTLTSYANEGVLFGTHSLGLARAVGQQIYAAKRIRQGESHVRLYDDLPRLAEFLGELSFPGYRELGFNKVLLVEGPTDVTTVQQFLRLLNKDHSVVTLPLGGASMINADRESELDEVRRLSDDVSVLIDSERDKPNAALSRDRQAFCDSCKNLGIRCHVLDRRAMENYFPTRAIQAVKGAKYRALHPFEALTGPSPTWGKAENWRIARGMTREELTATGDLGVFLSSV